MRPTTHKRDIFWDVMFPAFKIGIFALFVDLLYYLMYARHIGK